MRIVSRVPANRNVDVNLLFPVVTVAVNHRVDQAFPHRHADPMLLVFVETNLCRRLQNFGFRKIDALQRGGVVSIVNFPRACIQGHGSN